LARSASPLFDAGSGVFWRPSHPGESLRNKTPRLRHFDEGLGALLRGSDDFTSQSADRGLSLSAPNGQKQFRSFSGFSWGYNAVEALQLLHVEDAADFPILQRKFLDQLPLGENFLVACAHPRRTSS